MEVVCGMLANLQAEYVQSVQIQQKPEALFLAPDRLWLRVGQTQLLQIDSVAQNGTLIAGFHHYTLSDPFRLSEILEAEKGSFINGTWTVKNVVQHQVLSDGRIVMTEQPHRSITLPFTPEDFQNWLAQSPKNMTLYRLYDYIESITQDGHGSQRYVTDFWARVAFSIVPLVMTLLGVSISLRGSGFRNITKISRSL